MNDPFGNEFGIQQEAANSSNLLSLLPLIAWQRKWWVIIPVVLGAIAALASIYLLRPLYLANAVMLVESPQLPDDVLDIDGTEIIDRRIARIREQITSRPDLISLIERHGLYPSERQSGSLASAVEVMRDAIEIAPNQVANQRGSDNTIAFELSYSYQDPVQAQAVTQELMEEILSLDARGNVEQAANTEQFLQDQANELGMQIAELQSEIAQVTAANGGVLAGGGQIISGSSGGYDVQIAALQRDNQQLMSQRGIALSSDQRDPIVLAAEQQLAGARAIYADSHPDVQLARQRLAEARNLAKSNTSRLPIDSIDQQIAFNNSQISSLRAMKAREEATLRQRMAVQARAPLVQQRIGEMQQRLSTLNQQYDEVESRLLSARAGVRAEDEQMGERLVVVEPPVIPNEPISPDRPLILLVGVGGGLAMGFLLAFGIEFLAQPVRDPTALGRAVGGNTLGVVPVIETRAAKRTAGKRWRFWN